LISFFSALYLMYDALHSGTVNWGKLRPNFILATPN
jgi:hypothetical protein